MRIALIPAVITLCMSFLLPAGPADAAEVYASVSGQAGGYGLAAGKPIFNGPAEFMMFSQYPATLPGDETEQEMNPEDISTSELLHAYDAAGAVESDDEPIACIPADTALSGPAETDIFSPLTVRNEVCKDPVDRNINLFSVRLKDRFGTWLSRSGRYIGMMKDVFREKGLPEDLVYLALIESGFNPKAYSWAKASGPWQFITGTGKKYGLKIDWWVDERRDPVKSTNAAANYLKDLYDMFGTWSLSMAAYNGGEGRVSRAVNKVGSLDFWKLADAKSIARETREYVPRFIAAKAIAKDPASYGFDNLVYDEPFEYDEVTVDVPVGLDVIAKCCDTTTSVIKDLNPELRRWCTPPDTPGYTLRIPKDKKSTFLAKFEQLPESDRSGWSEYVVRRGDTLGRIAGHYNVPVGEIARMNNIRRVSMISVGQRLIIPAPGGPATASYASYEDDESYSGSSSSSYTVRRGDTLSSIARRHRMSTSRLVSLNGISTRSIIRPGQKLKVTGTASASVSSSGSYRIKRGDTIWDISRKFGVSMDSIMRANSLSRRSVLKPGQSLVIPSKSTVKT